MGKLLRVAASGLIGVTMSTVGASAVGAAPASGAHLAQYNPNVPSTSAVASAEITTPKPHGVSSSNASALPTTGSDSARLAGEGVALVVAGAGFILIRRRYAACA
jgi:LPXTG-motif cell wall-anchored protein